MSNFVENFYYELLQLCSIVLTQYEGVNMTRLELLEREINYQLKVYRGKTNKYQELKQELEFYKSLGVIFYISNSFSNGANHT